MQKTRRALLFVGGAVAVAASGLAYRAWDRGLWSAAEGAAYAPWSDWEGRPADGTKRPLRAAILAANPHDTQPWLFTTEGNTITIFADRARNLGSFDPFRREMHLGLGAAIENLVLTAQAFGWIAEVAPAEGMLSLASDDKPVVAAHITLKPAAARRDPLVAAIPHRHTNRGPYRPDQPIEKDALQNFAARAANDAVNIVFVGDGHARGALGALILQATEQIINDPQMSADNARWVRTGRRDIAAHRDGVTVDAAGLSPLMTAASKLLPDVVAKTADRFWLSMTRDVHVPTAAVLGVIFVRNRLDMRGAIAAGRAWQRLHLALTAAGLAAQPLNQPVECIDRNAMLGQTDHFGAALAEFAKAPGWEPTFVFRAGMAERPASRSPRRALDEVLRET